MTNYNLDQKKLYQPKGWGFLRTPTRYLLVLSLLLLFSYIIYKYFDKQPTYTNIMDAPIIKAEVGPHRIRPEDPGGIKIAHQDKQIYREIEPS